MVSVPPISVRKEVFVHKLMQVAAIATFIATVSWSKTSKAAPTCAALAEAITRSHPALRAAQHRARAATLRSDSEGSLPPPMLSFEIWDFPIGAPSRADREGMYMVGLGQEFPGGGRSDRARAE